jgi:hypothetical protein
MRPKDKKIAVFDQKKMENIFGLIFFLQFLVIKNLDPGPDPESLEMPDLNSVNWDPEH